MGKPGTTMQDRAVIREWMEAVSIGALDHARAIAKANPDLLYGLLPR